MKKAKYMLPLFLAALNIGMFVWNHEKTSQIQARASQTIMITSHGFTPNRLTYKQGDVISLAIHNTDDKQHNFVLGDYFIFSRNLTKGEMTTIQFTAHKKGSFTFFSDSPGHPEIGYKGEIEIN
ncbi:cupredoxin domain-containing protein [Aneurinibacillus tyrosinisolvens]|uniref:cupredoxin domain-containing protein n=1 Tax=Aneurinibacillus tyrosinisolvens TaxID=1443435 RepID=UPI00069B848A|nr:cupredoxin domain-containing protein [Aneurinibacillus tyrosinisolvens]